MTQLIPADRPINFQASLGNVVYLTGKTVLGSITVTSNSVTFSDDINDFLGLIEDDADQYPPLPVQGELVEAEQVYNYNDTAVICRQTHFRTEHVPEDIPALFIVYREGGNDLEWVPNEQVYVGDERTYDSIVYVCIQSHVTQDDWTPPVANVLWAVKATEGGEWQAGVVYMVDDEVTYNSVNYKCIQAHTSQVGWEPPNVPSLWSVL